MRIEKIIGKPPKAGLVYFHPFKSDGNLSINHACYKQYNYDPVVVDIVEDYLHGEEVEYSDEYIPFEKTIYIPVEVEKKCWYGAYPKDNISTSIRPYRICEMAVTHYRKAYDSEIPEYACYLSSVTVGVTKIFSKSEGEKFLLQKDKTGYVVTKEDKVTTYKYDYQKRKYLKILEEFDAFVVYTHDPNSKLELYLLHKTNTSGLISSI